MPLLNDTLDTFNTRCFDAFGQLKPQDGLRVGNYHLHFRGWKPWADSTIICGQWLAWPDVATVPKDARRFFVAQVVPPDVPPMIQEYHPGDSFEVCQRVYAEYLLDPAQQLHLLAWALRAKDALVAYVQSLAGA